MKSITIKGSKRESVGKVATKALRNAGQVPCVLYGGESPIHFSSEEKAFKDIVYTPNVYTATIKVDGQTYAAILQDIQFHPVTDNILHVDFYQLFDDKMVTMNIPVRLDGTSPGVLNGGTLRFPMRKLAIRAFPKDLPDYLVANISKLKIGSKLYVTQLATGDYTILHPDNTVVCQVRTSRKAVVDVATDGEDVDAADVEATEEGSTSEE